MIKVDVQFNYGSSWYSGAGTWAKGQAFDSEGSLLQGKTLAGFFSEVDSPETFERRLRELNGLFAIIIQRDETAFAAVDKIRSIPLLYSQSGKHLLLSDSIYSLSVPGRTQLSKDEDAVRFARSFGFTPAEHTLYSEIKQLRAGEYLFFRDSHLNVQPYIHRPRLRPEGESRKELEQQFLSIIDETTRRLSTLVGDRPVALPLSGGFDSRLIGLMLKKMGKENVTCFTFGDRNHREALASEQIASRLGYPWLFVDYRDYIGENYLQSPLFKEYVRFFSNGMSFPYLQEYFAGRYFKENSIFSPDTVFLPGHSGDMVGGSHLYPDMERFKSREKLAEVLYNRSGGYIPLPKPEQKALIEDIDRYIGYELADYTHQNHDEWNCLERQPKHIINSSRVWNFFGYEYLLPLWDDEFANFLLSLPFRLRVYKNFYDSVLVDLFRQNDLLPENEAIPSEKENNKAYIKRKLRENYPIVNRLRPTNHSAHDFFYFDQLLSPIREELNNYHYDRGIALLTEWYIRDFFAGK